jgi:hypothetical protein
MKSHRRLLVACFVTFVLSAVGIGQSFGQKPAPKAKPDPIADLKARVAALEGATVVVSYGECHLLPAGNNRYDPENAENRIVRCADGEIFNSWVTGVDAPFKTVKINCCKIITKIVPKRPQS